MHFNFDPPETGWSGSPNAVIGPDATAPTPPNALFMNFGGVLPSLGRTLSGLTVGQTYEVWVGCNFDDSPSQFVGIEVVYNSGASFDAFLTKNASVSGWEMRHLGTLSYDIADQQLQFVGIGTLTGTIRIDGIYIGEDPPSPEEIADMAAKWPAMEAAREVFRGINGDNFHTNLFGRVYSRYLTPATESTIEKPWGFFQQVNAPTSYEDRETATLRRWSGLGVFFFEEKSATNPRNTPAAQACDEFEDDVYEAINADPTLGGTVHSCEVLSIDPVYGVTPDYAEVHVILQFEQYVGPGDLRPA